MPSIEIHFPPYIFRIGRFNLNAIRYMLGTIINVIKNAKANPKIIVHDKGFQNTALNPPKKICGLKSESNVTKFMFSPMASGINANIAANAVSITGMIRVLPACIRLRVCVNRGYVIHRQTQSLKFHFLQQYLLNPQYLIRSSPPIFPFLKYQNQTAHQ